MFSLLINPTLPAPFFLSYHQIRVSFTFQLRSSILSVVTRRKPPPLEFPRISRYSSATRAFFIFHSFRRACTSRGFVVRLSSAPLILCFVGNTHRFSSSSPSHVALLSVLCNPAAPWLSSFPQFPRSFVFVLCHLASPRVFSAIFTSTPLPCSFYFSQLSRSRASDFILFPTRSVFPLYRVPRSSPAAHYPSPEPLLPSPIRVSRI